VVELSHDTRPIIGRGPPLGATFVTLAVASIALMVADQRYDQLAQVRAWLAAAVHPVQVAVDLPFRAWDWVTGSFADRSRLRRENLELTARLRLANLQLQRFAALEDENRRLRDMRANSAGVAERVLVASILNVDLDPFRHRVLVDKGLADGVFKSQAVLDGDGIVGQVSRVQAGTAEVILLSDAEHAIPVQSKRSGVRTIAVGTGDSGRLSLPFVTVDSDLKTGDLLLTTGIGGVFPPGYPVAEVTRVERNPAATFALVDARPTAKLDRAREVLLVWFEPPAVTIPATGEPAAAVGPGAAAAPGTGAAAASGAGAAAASGTGGPTRSSTPAPNAAAAGARPTAAAGQPSRTSVPPSQTSGQPSATPPAATQSSPPPAALRPSPPPVSAPGTAEVATTPAATPARENTPAPSGDAASPDAAPSGDARPDATGGELAPAAPPSESLPSAAPPPAIPPTEPGEGR
jgi:rod shape-determining protein MreC